jgi:disulfide bond formation protein DsbB
MYKNYRNSLYFPIFVISIIPLCIVYYQEYMLDILPCKLCTYQRIPYFFICFISLISMFFLTHKRLTFIKILIDISIITNFCLSIFHYCVEKKILSFNTSNCVNNLDKAKNIEQFQEMMHQQAYTLCDQVNLEFFGVSAVLWNTIYSLFFFFFVIFIYNNNVKNSHG